MNKRRKIDNSADDFMSPFEQRESVKSSNHPNNECSMNLHDMIDDCLLEIFSPKLLSTMDLCSLAETCEKFRQIARRVVPKELSLRSDYYGPSIGVDCTHDGIQRIFENFGSVLTTLELAGISGDIANLSLNLIADHCGDGSLKRLRMLSIPIPDISAVKLKPVFKWLEKLTLNDTPMPNDTTLFDEFDSLVELNLEYMKNCGAILENVFPKLKRFRCSESLIDDDLSDENSRYLATFISRHRSLKTLYLMVECAEGCDTNIVQSIGNSCNELEELHLSFGRLVASIQPLQTLKSLRTLWLNKFSLPHFQFFSAYTELRELDFGWCKIPEDLDQFACLRQITKLDLSTCDVGVLDVVGIIRQLTNLIELKLWSLLSLDEKTFTRIVSTVRGRPHVLTLHCKVMFKIYETQNVRLEHVDYL